MAPQAIPTTTQPTPPAAVAHAPAAPVQTSAHLATLTERFYHDWSLGALPVPFACCGVTQLWRANQIWREKSGARSTSISNFRDQIRHIAGSAVRDARVKLNHADIVRVLLVGERPEEKTLAKWVEDDYARFEIALEAWRRDAVVPMPALPVQTSAQHRAAPASPASRAASADADDNLPALTHNQAMLFALITIDTDYTATGAISCETMTLVRDLLAEMGVA